MKTLREHWGTRQSPGILRWLLILVLCIVIAVFVDRVMG